MDYCVSPEPWNIILQRERSEMCNVLTMIQSLVLVNFVKRNSMLKHCNNVKKIYIDNSRRLT